MTSLLASSGVPIVRLVDAVLGYRTPLLPPVSLDVCRGELWGIVGPNGGGKTTLLKALCGIQPPLSGRVEFPEGRPRVGYVPQRETLNELFPLSAREVVALNLIPTLAPWSRLRRAHLLAADRALDQLGILDAADRPFRELSGGQKQRALLARALVINPELLLLDEPSAALDPVAEERLLEHVGSIHRERGITVVLVSHQLGLTTGLAETIAIVDHARGVLDVHERDALLVPDKLREVFGATAQVGRVGRRPLITFASDEAGPHEAENG